MTNKLTTAQTAEMIGIQRFKLDQWRVSGKHNQTLKPEYKGRFPFYLEENVKAFMEKWPELQKKARANQKRGFRDF